MRVPAPIDVQRQLEEENEFLTHPPTPDPASAGPNNAIIPLEQRTRVLRFQLPSEPAHAARCPAPRRKLTIRLGRHAKSVRLLVDGRVALARHGRALRSVKLRRPARRRFVLTVVVRRQDGTTSTRRRTFTRC
jgi:hypothetical protein